MYYVVWVETGQEQYTKALCRKLLEADSGSDSYRECFIPMKEKAWRDKKTGTWTTRKEILFPGYLFFDADDAVKLNTALYAIPRFTKLLGDDDGAIPLCAHEVDFLERFTNQEHVLEMSVADLIGGEIVVKSGPMANYHGKVTHIDRRKRECTFEMEFFGRMTPFKVGLAVVEKID